MAPSTVNGQLPHGQQLLGLIGLRIVKGCKGRDESHYEGVLTVENVAGQDTPHALLAANITLLRKQVNDDSQLYTPIHDLG